MLGGKISKDTIFLFIICFGLQLSATRGSSLYSLNRDDYSTDDYQYDDDYTINNNTSYELIAEPQDIRVPEFLTTSKTVLVNEGGVIKLPCIVDELDIGLVLIWKRGSKIIALGDKTYEEEDKRVKVEKLNNGNRLVIRMAENKDAGEYVCQVPSTKTIELIHTVKIRVGPAVSPVPATGLLTVMEGEAAELGCDVIGGDPVPEVTWRRKNRRMPSGEAYIEGLYLTFLSATRHHSGIYVCSADNGWGAPAAVEIRLDVQHAPLIESEETLINNIEGGRDLEITCIVHSSPIAKVLWYKNGDLLSNTDNVISKRTNKHSLLLPDVERINRQGMYMCKALNLLGDATVEIDVNKGGTVLKKSAYQSHKTYKENNKVKNEVKTAENPKEYKQTESIESNMEETISKEINIKANENEDGGNNSEEVDLDETDDRDNNFKEVTNDDKKNVMTHNADESIIDSQKKIAKSEVVKTEVDKEIKNIIDFTNESSVFESAESFENINNTLEEVEEDDLIVLTEHVKKIEPNQIIKSDMKIINEKTLEDISMDNKNESVEDAGEKDKGLMTNEGYMIENSDLSDLIQDSDYLQRNESSEIPKQEKSVKTNCACNYPMTSIICLFFFAVHIFI